MRGTKTLGTGMPKPSPSEWILTSLATMACAEMGCTPGHNVVTGRNHSYMYDPAQHTH